MIDDDDYYHDYYDHINVDIDPSVFCDITDDNIEALQLIATTIDNNKINQKTNPSAATPNTVVTSYASASVDINPTVKVTTSSPSLIQSPTDQTTNPMNIDNKRAC